MKYKEGTRVFDSGDRANSPKFGTIKGISKNKFCTCLIVNWDNETKTNLIPISNMSEKYLGNNLTRFVTAEAYEEWKNNLLQQFKRRR